MAYDGFTVDTSSFKDALIRLSIENRKSQAENLRVAARGVLKNENGNGLLQITPPASKKTTGMAAKKQGDQAIDVDLARVFTAVKLKGKRKELWPDVQAIHRRLFISTKANGGKLRSDRGRAGYFVDKAKLFALKETLKRNVGKLASGWLAAADALGVTAPAWISRHGSARGTKRIELTKPLLEIEMTCIAPPGAPAAELERRVPYAIRYAVSRMERQIAFLSARAAEKAGFKSTG